jgi:threonine dehydrogenase-like Zn-dependent dehydrogenase
MKKIVGILWTIIIAISCIPNVALAYVEPPAPVPEPGTFILLGLGVIGLLGLKKKFKK